MSDSKVCSVLTHLTPRGGNMRPCKSGQVEVTRRSRVSSIHSSSGKDLDERNKMDVDRVHSGHSMVWETRGMRKATLDVDDNEITVVAWNKLFIPWEKVITWRDQFKSAWFEMNCHCCLFVLFGFRDRAKPTTWLRVRRVRRRWQRLAPMYFVFGKQQQQQHAYWRMKRSK